VASGLLLSEPSVSVGEAVTATFMIRNTSGERLHLSMLGIGSRSAGSDSPREADLIFDRSITLNPGRTYRFNRVLTFDEGGTHDLFVFALGAENEWLPLGGALQNASVMVEEPERELSFHFFLPTITMTTE
jgi:hypothetical protein